MFIPCKSILTTFCIVCQHLDFTRVQHESQHQVNGTLAKKRTAELMSSYDLHSKNASYFQCLDETVILSLYVCDGFIDCPDGSDEERCQPSCTFHQNQNKHISFNYKECLFYEGPDGGVLFPLPT